jgi:hypothetical protein
MPRTSTAACAATAERISRLGWAGVNFRGERPECLEQAWTGTATQALPAGGSTRWGGYHRTDRLQDDFERGSSRAYRFGENSDLTSDEMLNRERNDPRDQRLLSELSTITRCTSDLPLRTEMTTGTSNLPSLLSTVTSLSTGRTWLARRTEFGWEREPALFCTYRSLLISSCPAIPGISWMSRCGLLSGS